MKQILTFAAAALFSLFLLNGCSDSTSSIEDDLFGSASFDISGDIEGSKEGFADFDGFSAYGVSSWEISIHDFQPHTFSLTFMMIDTGDEIQRPGPGTYDISYGVGNEGSFSAFYVNTEDGYEEAFEYETYGEGTGGQLVITESSSDVVKGTFSFNAAKYDYDTGEVIGTISVTNGRFEARARVN
jgi:hypothetical protein